MRQFRLAANVVQNVVTYNVVLDVDNKDELLKPGMTAQVRLLVGNRQQVLRIPTAALRFRLSDEEIEKQKQGRAGRGAPASASAPASAAAARSAAAGRRFRLPHQGRAGARVQDLHARCEEPAEADGHQDRPVEFPLHRSDRRRPEKRRQGHHPRHQ
jgi:hypothetical protein